MEVEGEANIACRAREASYPRVCPKTRLNVGNGRARSVPSGHPDMFLERMSLP